MTSGFDDPFGLPLGELERRCRHETRQYRDRATSDPRFCLEIFRRAIAHATIAPHSSAIHYVDDEARNLLVTIYTSFVEAQISRSALRWCERDDIVQQTWLRFWLAAPNIRPFQTLEAALFYLKRTALCAIVEAVRHATVRQHEASLQEMAQELDGEDTLSGGVDPIVEEQRRRFQKRWQELLTDTIDRRIFFMRYILGMAPREIAPQLASEGVRIENRMPTARIVSDRLERCIRILQEDQEIRDLLQAD